MWFQTTTSDRPKDAPVNYAEMPACVQINGQSWHGSGFHPRDLLHDYEMRALEAKLFACGACHSERVNCIYLHYFHHPNESDVRLELVCCVCGTFTHHEYWR
jgi:hypothetical protein